MSPSLSPASHPVDVLRFAAASADICLCIVTAVTGGTLRAKGALMAVSEVGYICGYVSNGCVDADIHLQAEQTFMDGQARYLRYGEGSPYKDIALPCGGAIDIALIPRPNPEVLRELVSQLDARQAVQLSISEAGELVESGGSDAKFTHLYTPKIKLRIAGRGEASSQLARQAIASGFDVLVQSPELELLAGLPDCETQHLTDPSHLPNESDDRWTAVVFLFHDHDWEPHLLGQALNGPAFYVGAMGSQRTHDLRCEGLREAGMSEATITKIHGPIGLVPAMRDANLLALSILAEIISKAGEAEII